MDSELLLKIIGYFPDYLSALSRTLLRFFGQPLSKQLFSQSDEDVLDVTTSQPLVGFYDVITTGCT